MIAVKVVVAGDVSARVNHHPPFHLTPLLVLFRISVFRSFAAISITTIATASGGGRPPLSRP